MSKNINNFTTQIVKNFKKNEIVFDKISNRKELFDLSNRDYQDSPKLQSNQYKFFNLRVINKDNPHISKALPSTCLFPGVPIRTYKGDVGFCGTESIRDKRAYPFNFTSDLQKYDPSQIPLSIPSLLKSYLSNIEIRQEKKMSNLSYPHNETVIGENIMELRPCILNIDNFPNAMKFLESRPENLKKNQQQPIFYDSKDGFLYEINNGKKGERLDINEDILSLDNYRKNPEMFNYVNENYKNDIKKIAEFFASEGGVPKEFFQYGDLFQDFSQEVKDLTKKIVLDNNSQGNSR